MVGQLLSIIAQPAAVVSTLHGVRRQSVCVSEAGFSRASLTLHPVFLHDTAYGHEADDALRSFHQGADRVVRASRSRDSFESIASLPAHPADQ